MINAIAIDDEKHCLATLSLLVKKYCPDVVLNSLCKSAAEGLEAIRQHQPDLVLLDVEMPNMNGFTMLEQLTDIPFSVIFTTSYDQYAIKAIRFSALDYLLKPVDPKELITAVHKVQTQKQLPVAEQFQILLNQVHPKEGGFKKVAVPTSEGFELIPADEILRCEA